MLSLHVCLFVIELDSVPIVLQEVFVAMQRPALTHYKMMEQCACTQPRRAVSAHLDHWQKAADVTCMVNLP